MGTSISVMKFYVSLLLLIALALIQQGSCKPKPKTYLVETKSKETGLPIPGFPDSLSEEMYYEIPEFRESDAAALDPLAFSVGPQELRSSVIQEDSGESMAEPEPI